MKEVKINVKALVFFHISVAIIYISQGVHILLRISNSKIFIYKEAVLEVSWHSSKIQHLGLHLRPTETDSLEVEFKDLHFNKFTQPITMCNLI